MTLVDRQQKGTWKLVEACGSLWKLVGASGRQGTGMWKAVEASLT